MRRADAKVDRIIENPSAVVEGVDISGGWSRMFEQRVIWDYGVERLEEITRLDGAESLGWCYQCGKCVPVCPVQHVGDYGPRKIFRKVQTGVNLLEHQDLWLCTTCANCLRVCPKEVNMIAIMPAVREQAILQGHVPGELAKAFENTSRHGNPLGEPARKRADWVKGAGVPVPILAQIRRPVDVLWYVSDYTSYHPRGREAAQAMARVLTALGVDFAILGIEEKSDGDSIRLAGEKGLFEMLAEQNIATFSKYRFDKLVVMDPHAFNAFKNVYPKHGGHYTVLHYTQFLAPMIDRLRPLFKKRLHYRVTFHDPCYLGRHNGEYEAPRKLLQAIPGVELVEMAHYRANGFCCGGGGGGMWLDGFQADFITERLSDRRVREAAETGARVLAVTCPYEPSRFEDSVKKVGVDLLVLDIVELVDEAMGNGAAA